MKEFRISFLVTALCIGIAGWWGTQHSMGLWTALWLVTVLAILEVSLSFDNAVVNAGVLKDMSEFWRQAFLTVGILVAVFGMRLVFPIVIVSFSGGISTMDTIQMALNEPTQYSQVLTAAYPVISSFGGMFLLLVFLNFLFDSNKETHWLGALEERLTKIAKFNEISVFIALCAIFSTRWWVPEAEQSRVFVAGVLGVLLYLAVDAVAGGDADLALGPDRACGEDVVRTQLFESPWVLWCAPTHPLAQKRSVTWEQLHSYPLVAAGRDHERSVAQMHTGLPSEQRVTPVEIVDNISTAMGLAAADVAATLAPDYVGALAKPLGLVRRRILSPEVMRYVCLYSPARRATSPAAEGFSDHLIRILAKRK